MKNSLKLRVAFCFALMVVVGYFTLRTQTYSGSGVPFTASEGDKILVMSGGEAVNVHGSGVGYIRVTDGKNVIKGDPITGDNFEIKGTLDDGNWEILDGSSVDFVVSTTEMPITVVVNKSLSEVLIISFAFFMIALLLSALGLLVGSV